MRSGRPGPCTDWPTSRCAVSRNWVRYWYLSRLNRAYKPKRWLANRLKALTMMAQAEKPLWLSQVVVCVCVCYQRRRIELLQQFALYGIHRRCASDPTLMGVGFYPRWPQRRVNGGHGGSTNLTVTAMKLCWTLIFVFGVGNRWANRHAGSDDVYTPAEGHASLFMSILNQPKLVSCVLPDLGIVSDVHRQLCARRLAIWGASTMMAQRAGSDTKPKWLGWRVCQGASRPCYVKPISMKHRCIWNRCVYNEGWTKTHLVVLILATSALSTVADYPCTQFLR